MRREWEWRSVKVNMELLKYLPRPVGGLHRNQHYYSGKLADSQYHLELIMACSCICAHINTHQAIQRCIQTGYHDLYVLYICNPPPAYTHAVISDVLQGTRLCRVATLWSPFGVHMKRNNQSGLVILAQNDPDPASDLPLREWWQNSKLTSQDGAIPVCLTGMAGWK